MDSEQVPRWREIAYIIAPFLLLLILMGGANLLPQSIKSDTAVSSAIPETPPPTTLPQVAEETPFPTVTPLPTPSITPTPTATPYAAPSFPPDAVITLLGPPTNSAFQSADSVTFYWQWSQPLTEDQYLTLYLQVDGETRPFATLTEPNLGSTYRTAVQLDGAIAASSPVQWQIRLESTFADAPLSVSETRTMRVTSGE